MVKLMMLFIESQETGLKWRMYPTCRATESKISLTLEKYYKKAMAIGGAVGQLRNMYKTSMTMLK